MSSVCVEVLLCHLNYQRPELAKIITRPGSCFPHFINPKSFINGSLCVSESVGSAFVAEQNLSVNRTVSTLGERLFILS